MKDSIKKIYPTSMATYFRLHAHPELSFEEHQTAEYLAARLEEAGIEHRTIAGTGILAKIEGSAEGADLSRTIVLRADIDALPIEEMNNIPYASTHKGVIHTYKHNIHTSIL
ncbi:MAG: amidohydrolase, partial [Tidjanibacter sp.]|nr:amidohydrolase [Tidjanibacter sp.]